MKRIILLLLTLAFCAGCHTLYSITLTDGEVVTARGKPKFDRQRSGYFFKDDTGQPAYVPMVMVRQIEPASMKAEDDKKGGIKFLPGPGGQ